jgi:hypothetical protein
MPERPLVKGGDEPPKRSGGIIAIATCIAGAVVLHFVVP